MQSIESKFCQAIDILVDRKIEKAAYDKTILAQVISCVDATIGKYKVKYQDNICYAYSNNISTTYTAGTDVYILVPGGNLDREKTIIGTTKKLGINYINIAEGDEAYEYLGSNCIDSDNVFKLSSYKTEEVILYSANNTEEENQIQVDINKVNEYIKNSSTIICGAYFETSLEMEQRFQGDYGIRFILNFIDNSTKSIVPREYLIDVNKMTGNPYKFVQETRQYGIFEIDGINFDSIESISIFVKDFPNKKENIEEKDYDIFIRGLELYSAQRLKEEELNSYSVSILTPRGTFFDNTSTENESRPLQAQVKVKGKVIDRDSQSLEYYWFIEHNGVTINNPYYCKYGGQGWKCLNNFNVLKGNNSDPDVVEWIPGEYQLEVLKKDIIAKEVKFKCAVIYNDTVLSKTVIIKNLSSSYDISIISDSGTKFYYDIGNPSLTCLVNNKEELGYEYKWAVEDSFGQFSVLPETFDYNAQYYNDVSRYDELKSAIELAGMQTTEQTQELATLQQHLTNYEKLCRIESNKIHKLQISSIVSFSTYKCSVYNDGVFLGTAAIVITNSLENEGAYNLVINEGTQLFKYDENGVSPTSSSLEKPLKIKALTFTIYDNLGNPIDDEIAKNYVARWTVPTENTLLTFPDEQTSIDKDLDNGTEIFEYHSFIYGLENRYDISKTRNNIKLEVDYKGMHLIAYTNFTFIKEGESGTNGTNYVCRITPNTNEIVTSATVINGTINYIPINSEKWFKAELWENGEQIFSGVEGDENFEVSWSILSNKYKSKITDPSHLKVTKNGNFSCSDYLAGQHVADIIKVEIKYNNKTYYATYPLNIANTYENNEYKVYLKENTGFKYAIYTTDGQRPQYDDSLPFEIIVLKNINGVWEDVSLSTDENLEYSFVLKGRTYNVHTEEWIEENLLKVRDNNPLKKNQYELSPTDPYDGYCVTSGFECIIRKNGNILIRLHVPIHFMLNRYGLAALNGWDGNSIQIENEQGFILSPQVGAGIKESDNTFTGVLIGKVEDANEGSDAIGLIGYSKGQRSIFLDAETGQAQFGTSNRGQIIIDPTTDRAIIQSGNYVSGTSGMMIDFTTPEIKFGTGNFKVSKEGYLTAKGGGSIAGWSISNNSLSSNNIRIGSDGSISHTGGSWSISSDGSAKFLNAYIEGHVESSTINAGTITGGTITSTSINNGNGTFSVDTAGNLTATSGKFGPFTLNKDGLAYGNTYIKVLKLPNMPSENTVIDTYALYTKSIMVPNLDRIWFIDEDCSLRFIADTIDRYGERISDLESKVSHLQNKINTYDTITLPNIRGSIDAVDAKVDALASRIP